MSRANRRRKAAPDLLPWDEVARRAAPAKNGRPLRTAAARWLGANALKRIRRRLMADPEVLALLNA